ncbi:PilZ domain-containing protein [Novosphingobium sp. Leaf2]|uniref:PilZ domain-containing protein n=1 Tax=Novosphingobium sp. Leaf2 TaxID=1735670 RepID=UPI001F383F87|nr:PilZ domain-containing protein [Novosphingobium sp. Leaf2]
MEPRTVLAIQSTVHFDGHAVQATLANASSRGVLALFPSPPQRGTAVAVEIGGRVLHGQVRWRSSDRCGLAFKDVLDIEALAEVEGPAVQKVDARLVRRSGMDILRSLLR